jgi:hypothetical protein
MTPLTDYPLEELRAAIAAKEAAQEPDYEAWRPALRALYMSGGGSDASASPLDFTDKRNIRGLIAALPLAPREAVGMSEAAEPVDEDEVYIIGKRDGYAEGLAKIDCLTGGDGEYFASTIGPDCPDESAMLAKIVGRFAALTQTTEADDTAVATIIKMVRDMEDESQIEAAIRATLAHRGGVVWPEDAISQAYEAGWNDCAEDVQGAIHPDGMKEGRACFLKTLSGDPS